MKTYAFHVVLERDKWPDEPDEKAVWRAYIPALENKGAASWGYTKAEALKNIQEVTEMVIVSFPRYRVGMQSLPRSIGVWTLRVPKLMRMGYVSVSPPQIKYRFNRA